ncbi:MAG: hypothetical protein K8S27_10805 [Candidatus Omnitrophica bacterium]|nr:hypothetical protein [Candidatus Omnitrophota bacterium]
MNIFGLSALLVFLASLFFAFFLFFVGFHKKINKIWACYSFLCSIWGLAGLIISLIPESKYDIAFLFWQIAYVGIIPLPVLFLHFVSIYLNLDNKRILIFLYFIVCIFELINFISKDLFLGELKYVFDEFYWTLSPGPLLNIYTLIFVLFCIVFTHYLLLNAIFSERDKNKKNRLSIFFLGSTIGWTGGFLCFSLNYNHTLYPFGNFLLIFYPLFYTYAIFKHQLMDITVVIKRGLVYSVLVTIITAMYLIFVLFVGRLFQGVVGYQSFILNLIAVFVIAILFNPLRDNLQRFLDQRFFHGTLESLALERHRLEQELFHKEKLAYVGQLASSVVHEIRNPLTSLKIFVDYFNEKKDDPHYIKKFQEIMPAEIERINNVVTRLLSLSKPGQLSLMPINVCDVLDETLQLMSEQLRGKKIKVRKDYSQADINIRVDRDRIKQVFLNLFLNAIQAMEEGGILRCDVSCVKRKVIHDNNADSNMMLKFLIISIFDTGCGMGVAELKQLFTPFHTTKKDGIGLGLVISQEIIKEHRGSLHVESTPGVGTKFSIELPVN